MGLAARFTVSLGLFTGLLSAAACWFLLKGAADLQGTEIEKARRAMVAETAQLKALGGNGKLDTRPFGTGVRPNGGN